MKWISILIWLLFWAAMLFSQTAPTPNENFKTGFAAYQQGNYDLAIKNYNTAIQQEPMRNFFYYHRGMAYIALNDPQKALSDFKKSNQLVTTAEACYQIGAINYKLGEMEAAKAALEKARLIREDLENMNFYLGMIYFKDKQFADSYRCLHDYTEHNHGNPEAYYYQAYSEAKLGKNNEAALSLRMATITQSMDWKYYYKMYDLFVAMNDTQRALNNISMVIDLGERRREYYQQRAVLYNQMGDNYRAKQDMIAAEQLKQTAAATH